MYRRDLLLLSQAYYTVALYVQACFLSRHQLFFLKKY